jgi:hypothetical protein
MTENTAVPYLLPAPGHITASPWLVSVGERGEELLEGGIPGWDYDTRLSFRRRISVSIDGICEDCSLSPETVFLLLVVITTAAGSYRWVGYRSTLTTDSPVISEITIVPAQDTLQGDISLRTELLLHSRQQAAGRLAAREPGTRLWSEIVTASLEGSLSRFPISVTDFSYSFPDTIQAPWRLWWKPSALESNAIASLRLYLNSADGRTLEQLQDDSGLMPAVMAADVVRQIIVTLLGCDEFIPDPAEWPEHSLGQVAAYWIAEFFPERDPDTLRQALYFNPGALEAAIHHAVAATDV